jgi:hypothetical protein
MSEDIERSRGRPENYKQDRGGVPAEYGPYKGLVMSNVDPTRQGRLWVYIEAFGDGDRSDNTKWTTVEYAPPFFGSTPFNGVTAGVGTYPGNRNSYGMWFTPPDIGTEVLCVFANGARDKGYYIAVIPPQASNHMVPAIGARKTFKETNPAMAAYFATATQLPVIEINTSDPNVVNQPRYFEQIRPVQSVVAAAMWQQGLISDNQRGPIGSNAQRESPSQVFGISTPGRPIFQGGFKQEEIPAKLNANEIQPQDAKVIGRLGGHTFVMDDGSIEGDDQLIRLRTAKGHQITMSDSGEFFYITHANGQTWLEFGKQGTVDIYSSNSVNVRTQGTINLHADGDINFNAGGSIKMRSGGAMAFETDSNMSLRSEGNLAMYGKTKLECKSNGDLVLDAGTQGSMRGRNLRFTGNPIDLNGPVAPSATAPNLLVQNTLPDVVFNSSRGWENSSDISTIVLRAPTHEPYPGHNQGVGVSNINGAPSTPAAAQALPANTAVGLSA